MLFSLAAIASGVGVCRFLELRLTITTGVPGMGISLVMSKVDSSPAASRKFIAGVAGVIGRGGEGDRGEVGLVVVVAVGAETALRAFMLFSVLAENVRFVAVEGGLVDVGRVFSCSFRTFSAGAGLKAVIPFRCSSNGARFSVVLKLYGAGVN